MSIFLRQDYGKSHLTAKQILSDWRLFLAFGFGSGLSRHMPGTLGTVAAIPLYLVLAQLNIVAYSLLTLVVVLGGIPVCAYAAKKLEVHDFGGIVWDEVAGFLITMWLAPFSWQSVVAGFLLFRFFDIVKPWPIKWIDRKVHGGLGIMLDDVLAGLFAAAMLFFII